MAELKLLSEVSSIYSFAFQQNQYPLVSRLELTMLEPVSDLADESIGAESQAVTERILVTLTSDPAIFEDEVWLVDHIALGQVLLLPRRALRISAEYLENLSEQVNVSLTFKVTVSEDVVLQIVDQTLMLPKNHWGGESGMAELLAAFVTPNAGYVEYLVRSAAEVMKKGGHSSKLDGYQSATRERPYLMAAALWNVISSEAIVYVSPPVSFSTQGQKIRLPDQIQASKAAACLDTSLLFASCLEHIGLNSVVALTKGHACAGVWLIKDSFPVLTNDDPMDLRKRVASRDLVLFETTLVTSDHPVTFGQATETANELINEGKEVDFVFAIDIAQARRRKITPLPTLRKNDQNIADIVVPSGPAPLPQAPPLPPVRKDEQVREETAETRVDQWQRKLLDLTKRNRLLNLASKSVAVRLFCPDVRLLEDKLAAGVEFGFITPADSPEASNERDKTLYRFSTGNDLQVEFARDQLNAGTLIANDSTKQLESNLLNLYRKAKNDLEEGGSNTLFLAIGMLRWKETPTSDRSFRAPLILLPAHLIRASARAKIRVQQLPDELPIFNSTLIEFLATDYEIDLSLFRNELPCDESGIDVGAILDVVRAAVKEEPGFEVVEELVLSTFSFAKYLMWRDLKDRVADLKENPFVHHLIDNPQKAYSQSTDFLNIENLDSQLKPSEVYAPLNADSSQLVAIDASAKSQNFVLEGPPGTGKSETIANIIAHNISIGRKVLFVAEKMAALNVVHRRLERVHLDHLCMELHSSKANKAAVLGQLRRSWAQRERATQTDWENNANELLELRGQLNQYVNELHRRSVYGLSPRQAIARSMRYGATCRVDLGWAPDAKATVVKSASDLADVYDIAKKLGIAFETVAKFDREGLDLIQQADWSNTWQSTLILSNRRLEATVEHYISAINAMADQLGLADAACSIDLGEQLTSLAAGVAYVIKQPYSFAMANDATDRLDRLEKVISKTAILNISAQSIGLNFIMERACEYPVDVWASQLIDAEKKIWPLSWLAKASIKKQLLLGGLAKPDDLSILREIKDAQRVALELREEVREFAEDKVWTGWKASVKDMTARLVEGRALSSSIRQIAAQQDDPVVFVTKVRQQLIVNREFLNEQSPIAVAAFKLIHVKSEFDLALTEFIGLGGKGIDRDSSLLLFHESCKKLTASERHINGWCHWLETKAQANHRALGAVTSALENGLISPDDTVSQTTTAFCRWVAPILIDRSPVLRKFHAANHEALISEFRDLDALVAKTTSDYIAARAAAGIPDKGAPDSPSGFGVLARELQKKSRHKPVRALIHEMGADLLNLVPCMMMSPISVAQFLPSNFNAFDLVVFDEASQITVWDAVGAIARGKNVIVVGDPKQMPPSNFFGRSADQEYPDEEDLESILDQALAARLPHHRLTGHYRSRHESLIAFSNSHYYENSLVTFPSAETKSSAVVLHRVNGLYSKGKGRNNIVEAQAVADEVVRRLRDPKQAHLTIGVVTLNSEQQRTIEDALDTHRRNSAEIEPFFHATDDYDPVFVKNLESVQGDERDVIILSFGYGPTELGARKISMNFGPLNKQGGERRLNVAITRATTELLVFSSFDSSMIDLSRTRATAVEHLKDFLEYAERGPAALAQKITVNQGVDEFDSDFEMDVAIKLREFGWVIQSQVGVSKFRIDLGVIHPDHPGKYLAGIECDGATYHSSPSARDRDRVRHIILENLGWDLIRLWSTDYFIDAESALQKMHLQLVELLAKSRAESADELLADDGLQ